MMNELITILGGLISLINAAFLIYFAAKRNKPEVKKLEGEAESELQEATNLNLEGAKISAQMLLDRINELKGELETERSLRKEGMALAEKSHNDSMEAMKKVNSEAIMSLEKARKEDREYFRRRIRDLERDIRDYRNWAAKLNKQVVEAGKIPVPFIPSAAESDPSLTSIRVDLESDDG